MFCRVLESSGFRVHVDLQVDYQFKAIWKDTNPEFAKTHGLVVGLPRVSPIRMGGCGFGAVLYRQSSPEQEQPGNALGLFKSSNAGRQVVCALGEFFQGLDSRIDGSRMPNSGWAKTVSGGDACDTDFHSPLPWSVSLGCRDQDVCETAKEGGFPEHEASNPGSPDTRRSP